jgi:hypothetical protein
VERRQAGEEDEPERRPEGEENPLEGFGLAAFGALYASIVTAAVIAVLDTDFGRELQRDLDAPARAMVAAPVLALAAVVFVTCVLALILPAARVRLLGIAGMAGWLIPAWLLMSGLVLGAIAFALDSLG